MHVLARVLRFGHPLRSSMVNLSTSPSPYKPFFLQIWSSSSLDELARYRTNTPLGNAAVAVCHAANDVA